MLNLKIGIFIFRRDLRLDDNLGLLNMIKQVDIIYPIFILDKNQIIKNSNNKNYFSNNAVQFMCESLIDLNNQLKKYNSNLRLFYGYVDKIIEKIIKSLKDYKLYLGYNKDFSIYSIKRDNQINDICSKYDIETIITDSDYTCVPLNLGLKNNDLAYKQYGAFYKNIIKHKVNNPIKNKFKNYFKKMKLDFEFDINDIHKFYKFNEYLAQNGGRTEVIEKLKDINNFKDYNNLRDRLDYNTTNLSAYLNFGCISIREVYHTILNNLGKNSILLKQLYWRDFYLTALIYLPNANKYKFMDNRYNLIKWKNKKQDWNKLFSGTGFLIIDAAIQEMKISGFMHNRARMLVGSFWTKYLLINSFHPIYGSQVGYSKYLVDAIGPSQNKMNHHWITEFDYPGKKYAPSYAPIAGRPMDISNKTIKKYDPDCKYIKKWLPHLNNINNKDLINWNADIAEKYNNIHPSPIFDSKLKYQEWINSCKINIII
jgi:deoxyribodipyrimidine photo-lyase